MKGASLRALFTAAAKRAAGMDNDSRRRFLQAGITIAGGSVVGRAAAQDSLRVEEWSRRLARGVVSVPYGVPSAFE
ncbi:MAG: hypothetical protein ACR2PV_07870, partial [Gammaproteobacteria bacterium]